MIQEYLKNPKFYFIAVPVLAAAWAVYARTVAVPQAQEEWDKQKEVAQEAETQIHNILELTGLERLEYQNEQGESESFDYATVIQHYAKKYGIPESGYSLLVSREVRKRDKRSQSATISIDQTDIVQFTNFLSDLLLRWPDLQCDQVKLSQTKAGPDTWKVSMKLTYIQ